MANKYNLENVVAIIPARGGSKGFPNKNIINFCGKPLLAWSIIQGIESKSVAKVYVTSDSNKILSLAQKYGAIPIKRPKKFATDTSTSESALLHALDIVESRESVNLVIFLQATSPLREAADIDGAVKKLLDEKADSLFSSAMLEDFFIWQHQDEGLISLNYDFKNRLRRQDLKTQYVENGSIYVFKPEILRRYKNRLGGRIATYEMAFWKTWEIDSMENKELCEWYMRRYLLKKSSKIRKEDIDLIIYDFDGVLTDNKVVLQEDGQESVIVNRADGLAIGIFKKLGIGQIIITTETNKVVEIRARKLGIPVISGVTNKKEVLLEYCKENNISPENVIYVGNDINDIEAMKTVGYPICSSNAYEEIKDISKIILYTPGGDGVVRDLLNLFEIDQ